MFWIGNLANQGILEVALMAAGKHCETAILNTHIRESVGNLHADTSEITVDTGELRIRKQLGVSVMETEGPTVVTTHENRCIQTAGVSNHRINPGEDRLPIDQFFEHPPHT